MYSFFLWCELFICGNIKVVQLIPQNSYNICVSFKFWNCRTTNKISKEHIIIYWNRISKLVNINSIIIISDLKYKCHIAHHCSVESKSVYVWLTIQYDRMTWCTFDSSTSYVAMLRANFCVYFFHIYKQNLTTINLIQKIYTTKI